MKLVSGIVDSGFFAQSALSAEVATKDSLGRNISETYLIGVDQVISSYNTATYVNSAIITDLNGLELSARQSYHARTAYYDQNGVNLANATNSAKSGYAASAWITEHSSDYQTTAGMTAYQSAGDYYSASNPSGFITGVPDTYLQNTDLSTADGKVTAISGIPLSAGGDVPEGVMVESGLEYNAVNEISGYNGSAIAQYGAEKQWLVHDDTLVHASNSAQYALGCNISALQRLMGIDETLLWSGTITATGQSVNLNEPISNFSKLKFILSMDSTQYEYVDNNADRSLYTVSWQNMSTNDVYLQWMRISANNDKTKIAIDKSKALAWPGGTTAVNATACYVNWEWSVRALTKVIGIGRKQ